MVQKLTTSVTLIVKKLGDNKMENSISIKFGTPKHGWLPIDFYFQGFHLDFNASDVLNDPIEELFNAITNMKAHGSRQVTWWLEPGAYFFDIEKKGEKIEFTISETEDLHNEKVDKKIILAISADYKKVIEPIRLALKQFCMNTYEENHWPYKLDKDKLERLLAKDY